jgi:hypothetical protein
MQGCESRHVETVHVHGKHNGGAVWRGDVEVFQLVGHLSAVGWMVQTPVGHDDARAVTGMVIEVKPSASDAEKDAAGALAGPCGTRGPSWRRRRRAMIVLDEGDFGSRPIHV